MMKWLDRLFSLGSEAGREGRFLQLWVIALVFGVFSTLFFISAMMDLRRLENMLVDLRTRKAQYITEGIQKVSEKEFDHLLRVKGYGVFSSGSAFNEPCFSPQESLRKALIDRAKSIEYQEQTHSLSREDLLRMARSEDFFAIAVLGGDGEVSLQTAPLPDVLIPQMQGLARGNVEVAIHLSEETDGRDSFTFVCIRRQEAQGVVVLVLDAKGIRHWMLKVAIQRAIEELRWVGGVTRIAVEDTLGRPLALAETSPVGTLQNQSATSNPASGSKASAERGAKLLSIKSIEISLPFQFHNEIIGTAHVGLQTGTDQFVIENRLHIFIWTGLTILVGLFAMGLLYQTQNRHISRLQAVHERLHQAEKLSSLTKLAAGVAHEVRNPLNAISMATQRLQTEFSPPEGKGKADFDRITYIVRDEVSRLNSIVEDFLSVSRSERLNLRPQPIVDVLERLYFLVREEAQGKGIHIEKPRADISPRILMDAGKMEQALLNIVRNAMESIPGDGSISISIEDSGNSRATIIVQDSGVGIPREELGRIFDPYYTTKEKGVGIGLYMAHEIIAAHGGEILLQSSPGKGTILKILLPQNVD